MKLASAALCSALLLGCSQQPNYDGEKKLAMVAKASPTAASAAHPAVLELYQSQGCSSCPPANANVNKLADRPDVLALSFAVTYWDRLGWKDRFAKPAYTDRQWDFANANRRSRVYTPQIIVNGGAPIVGDNAAEIDKVLAERGAPKGGPSLAIQSARLTIGEGDPKQAATVWLVRYDPRTVNVPIATGENAGRTLPHRNVVHELVALGEWSGRSLTLTLPGSRNPAWQTAILMQDGKGGQIIGAVRA